MKNNEHKEDQLMNFDKREGTIFRECIFRFSNPISNLTALPAFLILSI